MLQSALITSGSCTNSLCLEMNHKLNRIRDHVATYNTYNVSDLARAKVAIKNS